MVRTATVDRNGLRKGAWSPEEDEKLRVYIQRYGAWNWRQLPKFAGLSRCGKSCRLRWMNYLRPGVKHGSFSKDEHRLISQLHKELGNKWSRIALRLPGRTDNEIKNHWHTHIKKRKKQHQTVTEVVKGNIIVTSESTSQTTRLGDESSFIGSAPSLSTTILERSPLSASDQETSANGLPSSGVDHASMPDINYVAEDGLASIPAKVFEESSSVFWTQPFLVDNAYDQEIYPLPSCSLTEEDYILTSASYSDNTEDLICKVMPELP